MARFATKDDIVRIVDERIAASESRMKEYVDTVVSKSIVKQTRWMAGVMAIFAAAVTSAIIGVGLS